MQPINLIGYSGHAYVVCEILHSVGRMPHGYFEQEAKVQNPFGLQYLGPETADEALERLKNQDFFVAIGDNRIRQKIHTAILQRSGRVPVSVLHRGGSFSTFAKHGAGLMLCNRAVVHPMTLVGDGVIINTAAVVEHECQIGDFAHIAPGAILCGNVSVGEHSFVGAGAVVIQGIRIGKNVMIGAGAVLIQDVPGGATVVGNPQRPVLAKK